jgi:hypothetical protein
MTSAGVKKSPYTILLIGIAALVSVHVLLMGLGRRLTTVDIISILIGDSCGIVGAYYVFELLRTTSVEKSPKAQLTIMMMALSCWHLLVRVVSGRPYRRFEIVSHLIVDSCIVFGGYYVRKYCLPEFPNHSESNSADPVGPPGDAVDDAKVRLLR